MARPSHIKARAVNEKVVSNPVLVDLATRLAELKGTKKELEEQVTEINKEIDAITRSLHDHMHSLGTEQIKVAGLGSFTAGFKNRPNIVDKPGFIAYLDATGQGDIAPRTVHPQKLIGWVNNELEDGRELPESIANFQQPNINFRKA